MEHGIRIRTVILLWLLFSGVSYSHAQDYSIWGEIYEYNVGDIFHKRFSDYSSYSGTGHCTYENIEVLTKVMSSDSTSAVYTVNIDGVVYSDGPTYYYSNTATWTYNNLNNSFIADTIYYSNDYNGRKISYKEYWGVYPYDYQWREYVDGLGLTNEWHDVWTPYPTNYEGDTELLYYKKGDEEWGTPYIIVNTDELTNDVRFGIYPNPAHSGVIISGVDDYALVEVSIYNTTGQRVVHQQGSDRRIDVSSLQQGLYVVEVVVDKQRIREKLIIQ